MIWLDLLWEATVVGLGVWAAVECLHHGAIFERLRAYLEARGGFFSELFVCPYCLSHNVGLLLAAVAETVTVLSTGWSWSILPRYLLVWLAAVRLANLGNDLAHDRSRTPRPDYGSSDEPH